MRLRATGARQSARDVDRTAGSVRRLDTNTRSAGRSSNIALRQFTKLGGGLRLIGKGTAAAGLALGAVTGVMAKQSITAASDLNEEINKTGAVFGKSSADVLAWSKQSASAFGQSRQQALGAAGAIGSLLIPMNFARKDAANMSKRMVGLASDMASFSNTSPQEALDAIRSGLVGEQEPLRKYGISLNDAVLKQKALSLGLYSGKGNLDASAKAAATYRLIIDRLNRSHTTGDFARTRKSFANQLRILSATWKNLQAAVGGPLMKIANRALAGIIPPLTHVTNVASDVFADKNLNWHQKIDRLGDSIRHWFGPIATDMVTGLRNAHLDQKLEAVIRASAPQIAHGFAFVAPIAAQGFITGFRAAPAWAQFLTVAYLAKRLGVFSVLGRMAAGRMCASAATTLPGCLGGKLAAPGAMSGVATAMSGSLAAALPAALVAAGIGGIVYAAMLPTNDPATSARSGNPEGVRAHHVIRPGDGPTGAQIYSRRTGDPVPANTEAYANSPDIVIPVTLMQDGKPTAKAVARASTKKKATR